MDNLFTSMDLLDHMGDRKLGITGTLRQNRILGIPLPNKKEAEKNFTRGQCLAVYTQDNTVVLWKDNRPVYMASNCDEVEPMATCSRFSKTDRAYIDIPQPNINTNYNKAMGGVDLIDNAEKNYAITTRVKKWYWSIYAWFLNIIMVQAWRLFRAHKRAILQETQQKEKEEEEEWERRLVESNVYSRNEINIQKRETEKERKRRLAGLRKITDLPLLEFTRQVVELTIKKHADCRAGGTITSQQEASAKLGPLGGALTPTGKLSASALETVRFDSGRHLPRKTEIQGVCKECKKRSFFRCIRCNVALHAE